MQQTLFIVILAVVIALALAYRWKKKTENKMGNDLNALIEANDWCGVCRILRKQLIIWGVLLALCIALLIVRIVSNSQFYTPIQGGRIKMRSPPKVLTGNFRPSQLSFFLS